MSFVNLPVIGVALGLAALAGVLYLLQRLRVKYRDLQVPTTLFWREAVQETRARVLVRRFRHPLAYLLVLGIGSLLWLAISGLTTTGDDDADHVVLLDGSAGMARKGRFALAVERLRGHVGTLPRARTTVLFCGAYPRTLLRPGEHAVLLDERLATLVPEATPATVETVLHSLISVSRAQDLAVDLVGDAPVREDTLASLPADVDVQRVPLDPDTGRNRGITALGVSEASSGDYQRVDVLIELGGDDLEAAELSVQLDGQPATQDAVAETRGGQRRFLLRNVPARGQSLGISLSGDDALALDDVATIRLPERRPYRVAMAPDLHPSLRLALAGDSGVLLDERPADMVVRRAGQQVGADLPALELVPATEQADAFLIVHDSEADSATVLSEALDRLGLAEIDAMDLAQRVGKPITVTAVQGTTRTVRIWEELLTDRFDFTRSRAFPMFTASAVRWLGGERELVPYAAAGETWRETGAWHDADGTRLDPAGTPLTPPVAGSYRSDDGNEVSVSLTDRNVTLGSDAGLPVTEPAEASAGLDVTSWLGLCALLLLGLEWFLYRSGRMP